MSELKWNEWQMRDQASRIPSNYDSHRLQVDIDYEIKRLSEHIEDSNQLINLLKTQLFKVKNTKFTYTTYLNKSRNYATKIVQYYVGVFETPNIVDGERYRNCIEPQLFVGGNKLREALEMAVSLSNKYAAPIILDKWGLQKEGIRRRLDTIRKGKEIIEIR